MVLEEEEAPRGSFLNSGGALAMSFNLRGTEEDATWNSFGRPACLLSSSIRGGGGGDISRVVSSVDWTFFLSFAAFLASAYATFSALALLRVMARDDSTADLTRGLKSSSTRLYIYITIRKTFSEGWQVTHLLKFSIDSHGWIVKDVFLDFSLSSLPVIRPVVFRLFPPRPSFPSPSSSFRFFKFHSSLIACALRTRAADFGIASFRNDSFPGANSEPLAINEK